MQSAYLELCECFQQRLDVFAARHVELDDSEVVLHLDKTSRTALQHCGATTPHFPSPHGQLESEARSTCNHILDSHVECGSTPLDPLGSLQVAASGA